MKHRRTMWITVASIALVAQAVLAWAPASAGEAPTVPPSLLSGGPVAAGDGARLLTTRPVEVDLGLLRRGQARRIRLNLFDDATFDTELVPAPGGVPGWDNWRGSVVGVANSSVTLMRRGVDVTALLVFPGGTYRIKNVGRGKHVAQQIGTAFAEGDDEMVPPGRSGDQATPDAPATVAPRAPEADPVIDVLVAYTPAAVAAAGSVGAVQSEAALAISTSNTAYNTSAVNGSLRLAGTMLTSGNILPDEAGLTQLTDTDDNVIDEVHARRDAVGADLVDVLTGDHPTNCGIAWLLSSLSVSQAAFGFSVTTLNCAVDNLSFPHELGHNMGLSHDRFVTSSNPVFAYGFGYVHVPGQWRTVMAYNNKCAAAGVNCTRLARFSNPAQSFGGVPVGRPIGAADAADNHTALNNSMATVGGYRAGSVDYAPFNSAAGLVRQQYLDFIGRPPTASESSTQVTALNNGTKTKAGIVSELAHSTSFGGAYGPIARLYFAYFLRSPDRTGLDYWVGRYRGGTSLSAISGAFAGSNEFETRYGTLTNREFVEQIYLNVLGRPGNSTGIAYWTGQLDQARKTRGAVMIGFSESNEFKRVRKEEIDTILTYRGLLQRTPTSAEFTAQVQRLEAGTALTTIINEILATPAYAARITP